MSDRIQAVLPERERFVSILKVKKLHQPTSAFCWMRFRLKLRFWLWNFYQPWTIALTLFVSSFIAFLTELTDLWLYFQKTALGWCSFLTHCIFSSLNKYQLLLYKLLGYLIINQSQFPWSYQSSLYSFYYLFLFFYKSLFFSIFKDWSTLQDLMVTYKLHTQSNFNKKLFTIINQLQLYTSKVKIINQTHNQ